MGRLIMAWHIFSSSSTWRPNQTCLARAASRRPAASMADCEAKRAQRSTPITHFKEDSPVRKRISFLACLALMIVLVLPLAQSSSAARLLSCSPYITFADSTSDPSGGHGTGTNLKVARQRAGAGQQSGWSPSAGTIITAILEALLSISRL